MQPSSIPYLTHREQGRWSSHFLHAFWQLTQAFLTCLRLEELVGGEEALLLGDGNDRNGGSNFIWPLFIIRRGWNDGANGAVDKIWVLIALAVVKCGQKRVLRLGRGVG
jgi:hypothetical protein